MVVVFKIGGSLLSYREELRRICGLLRKLAGEFEILIVPGGGPFADTVREVYSSMNLPEETSHRMAVLAMDQYGVLLQSLIGDQAKLVEDLKGANGCFGEAKVAVLQASHLMGADSTLPRSWGVTSDSIAAWVAGEIRAQTLILTKAVDGLRERQSKRLLQTISLNELASKVESGCIDEYLPELLGVSSFRCFIVNGRHVDRVEAILRGENTVGTEIVRR